MLTVETVIYPADLCSAYGGLFANEYGCISWQLVWIAKICVDANKNTTHSKPIPKNVSPFLMNKVSILPPAH